MSEAITRLQPTLFSFTIRFVQGYHFLDKCGEALVRLENTLDEGWIPGKIAPTGGQLHNYSLGMGATFDSALMTVSQTEFLSFEHFHDQTCKTFDVLRSTFDIRRILAPVLRIIYQVGFAQESSAEDFLRNLQLCRPSKDVTDVLGGSERALTFTLCTEEEIDWQDIPVKRRRRLNAGVIRQERQPRFDERLMLRAQLLPERQQGALSNLRKLRAQHSEIVDTAVHFDMENSFEGEFNSGTFDLPLFLKESRTWTEGMEKFIYEKYRS